MKYYNNPYDEELYQKPLDKHNDEQDAFIFVCAVCYIILLLGWLISVIL